MRMRLWLFDEDAGDDPSVVPNMYDSVLRSHAHFLSARMPPSLQPDLTLNCWLA